MPCGEKEDNILFSWESCPQIIYVQSSAIVKGFPDDSSDADSLLRRIREHLCDSAAASVAFGSALGRAHCLPFLSFLCHPHPQQSRDVVTSLSSANRQKHLALSKL